jgi:hypothetical protein
MPNAGGRQRAPVDTFMALRSRYLTTREGTMNAFYEHHQGSIRFGYRCFDRILLNGVIQPFQQPERVIGFFNAYRERQLNPGRVGANSTWSTTFCSSRLVDAATHPNDEYHMAQIDGRAGDHGQLMGQSSPWLTRRPRVSATPGTHHRCER